MKLLIVEDERKIANALRKGLEQEAFAVDVAYDGDQGLIEVENEDYDLVVLDRMMPGKVDGVGILKSMRESGDKTPVLFLTAKDALHDKVEGLNAGADDYLVKPFAFEELLARVRALLRRPQEGLETVLKYKDVELNPTDFFVTRQGVHIDVSRKEFALLEYLMRNQGRTLTKDAIIQHVWDYDADILPNTVEVFVGYLRNKLEKPFESDSLIHTIRGFGYRFGEKN